MNETAIDRLKIGDFAYRVAIRLTRTDIAGAELNFFNTHLEFDSKINQSIIHLLKWISTDKAQGTFLESSNVVTKDHLMNFDADGQDKEDLKVRVLKLLKGWFKAVVPSREGETFFSDAENDLLEQFANTLSSPGAGNNGFGYVSKNQFEQAINLLGMTGETTGIQDTLNTAYDNLVTKQSNDDEAFSFKVLHQMAPEGSSWDGENYGITQESYNEFMAGP